MPRISETSINVRAIDENGDPVSGAILHAYEVGTSTPVTVYADDALTVLADPISNASGVFPPLYLPSGYYKIDVVDGSSGKSLPGFPEDNLAIGASERYGDISSILNSTEGARGEWLIWEAGGMRYSEAASDSSDFDIETAGGVKLYALPDQNGRLNVLSFGVDNAGDLAIEEDTTRAFEAAKSRSKGLFFPSGFYRVEKGVDFISSLTISGFALNMDIRGAGLNSTIFYSHGSPDYVLKVNARYVTMGGFSVWGSRDGIRDRTHSARIGIYLEDFREGQLNDFKVEHIDGPGLQIDQCIVSRVDGIVYRCGRSQKTYGLSNVTVDTSDPDFKITVSCDEPHDFREGQRVYIRGNVGADDIEDAEFTAADVTTSAFRLKDEGGNYVSGENLSTYVSGGTVRDFPRAVEQTVNASDGYQASWFRLNCEDAHGNAGGMRWLNTRNSHIDVKMEVQPYEIGASSDVTGKPVKGASVTFTGGASALIRFSPNNIETSHNGVMGLVFEEVVGTIYNGDTFTTVDSSGSTVTGTLSEIIRPGGPQFEKRGAYGNISLYVNQNELKEEGPSVIVEGDENEFSLLKLRGGHKDIGVQISGSRNTIHALDTHMGMTSSSDLSDYTTSVLIDEYAHDNVIQSLHITQGPNLEIKGHRNVIGTFKFEDGFGQAANITGNNNTIGPISLRQASYTDTEGVYSEQFVNLVGDENTIHGGVAYCGSSGFDVFRISGDNNIVRDVNIPSSGRATNGYRVTGKNAEIISPTITLEDGATGILARGRKLTVLGGAIMGGQYGMVIESDTDTDGSQTKVIGTAFEGYSSRGIWVRDALKAIRIRDCDFETSEAADWDVQLEDTVTGSRLRDNYVESGVGAIDIGTGLDNIETDTIH